ncbi:MAG: hypothetical protein ACI92O_000437 [Colwellia sp.]|jgi:hypothetical protein
MITTMEEVLDISESFGGANFWYGCRMRPPGIGCHPEGTSAIISNQLALNYFTDIKDKVNIRHGAIAYPKALTAHELSNFELVDLNIINPTDMPQSITNIMNEVLQIMIGWSKGTLNNPRDVRNLLSEIEDDGHYLLRTAYKEMSQFTQRKDNPDVFANFQNIITNITPATFVQHIKYKVQNLKTD